MTEHDEAEPLQGKWATLAREVSKNGRADVYLRKATVNVRDRDHVRSRELYLAEVMLPDPVRVAVSERDFQGGAVGSCDVVGLGLTDEEALRDLERLLGVLAKLGTRIV